MDKLELIETRRSVRTFDGKPLSAADRQDLEEYCASVENPYGLPVRFVFLDAAEHGLSSPVIKGEGLYIAAIIEQAECCEEAYGYSFEKMVLHAWSRGIGTTWIAGTMKRARFEAEAGVQPGEWMYCVTPVGYPAKKMSFVEARLRSSVKGDERVPSNTLFFDGAFGAPLVADDPVVADALKAVRLAPSAANKQPWRVVRDGRAFHFYEAHTKGFDRGQAFDVQRVDIGIALCHFIEMTGGTLAVDNPGIEAPAQTDYIATVRI